MRLSSKTPIETERLILATLSKAHAHGPYLHWMNDPEIVQFLESREREFRADDLETFVEACNQDPNILLLGIFLKPELTHIGNIKLGPVESRHARGDVGLVIGNKARWGQGFAREAIAAVTDYAFKALNLHKLTAGCYMSNVGSQRAFLGAGWHEEAQRPRHCRYRNQWEDVVLLACFNDLQRHSR